VVLPLVAVACHHLATVWRSRRQTAIDRLLPARRRSSSTRRKRADDVSADSCGHDTRGAGSAACRTPDGVRSRDAVVDCCGSNSVGRSDGHVRRADSDAVATSLRPSPDCTSASTPASVPPLCHAKHRRRPRLYPESQRRRSANRLVEVAVASSTPAEVQED